MALSAYLITDDLTIILGLVAACLFLLHNLYKPQSLVHPILLGRQSDAARVRHPGESAVYRNYSTGMLGRFPVRPGKDEQVLLDLVKPTLDAPRTLWSTKITNPELRDRAAAFGTGLILSAKLTPQESNVLLLLNDGIEFLITDLALASYSIPSFVLSSLALLSPVLENHPPSVVVTDATLLPHLLETLYDSHDSTHPTIVVIGDVDSKHERSAEHVQLLKWEDVQSRGLQESKLPFSTSSPQDVVTVAFHTNASGELEGTQFTHENLTAAVAATRNLLPLSSSISSLDTIVSAFSMSTPFGRAVAYTAIYEGTSFTTLDSTRLITGPPKTPLDVPYSPTALLADLRSITKYHIPSPTVVFATPSHLNALTSAVVEEARKSSFLYSFAWRHKFASLLEGFLTRQSLWDRLVFDAARVKVLGKAAGTIRAAVSAGGPIESQSLVPMRIALSIPIVNAHTHPLVAGPVFASHPLDLQTFPAQETVKEKSSSLAADIFAFTYLAAVGPPSVNIEAKLLGVNDAAIEAGGDPVGALHIRGPSVGKAVHRQDAPEAEEGDRWVSIGQRAKVLPNGTFKVVANALK
ncbi:hypothetical protein DAEQUDRAFT_807867 [Daedalea quercina L-15889]|uniref:Acetyl-CoA synthetase-like protein n=1 Tax=Daedalea quercina L-15889 TaxID=1314783 RepID=A0A165TZZ3_9APHY|nr:hypothetical protein DAEQUDRAFT_807867 [Daedalea quercina L-15889]